MLVAKWVSTEVSLPLAFLFFFGRDLQQFALQLGNEIKRIEGVSYSMLFHAIPMNSKSPRYKLQDSMQHNLPTQLPTSASLPSEALQEFQR